MSSIVADFESRSVVDLKACGVHPYAAHPLTEIMCLSAKLDSNSPVIYIPRKFERLIDISTVRYEVVTEDRIVDMILSADVAVAMNSMFEYVLWNKLCVPRYGWPELPLEKLHDTRAQLAYHALPLNLADAGKALNLSIQKDDAGHKAMLKLCKVRQPRKAEKAANPDWQNTIYWNEDPKLLTTLFNYCCVDVEAEYLIYHTLDKLPPMEREIWLMDQRINLRGVPVDVERVKTIVRVVGEREEQQLASFAEHSGGAVSGPRSFVKLREWVNAETGLNLDSLDKNATAELLAKGGLPEHVEKILRIKSELSKSSVAKFRSMLNHVDADGRIRDMFGYHTAATGRWAGRAVQLHNLPRDSYDPETWEHVLWLLETGNLEGLKLLFDDIFYVASRCVRGALCCAEGD